MHAKCPSRPSRRGAIMVLALIAVAVAFILGMTFMATSTPTVDAARTLSDHAQSRQVAEAGLGIAISYVERTADWRLKRSEGTWMNDFPLLGGTAKIEAAFLPEISSATLSPADASFEAAASALPTPLLSPPMSGTVGGWQVRRTAALATGPTVPGIGSQATANATDGSNAGFVSFGLSVNGSGTLSQTISQALAPRTRYELVVDITRSTGLSTLRYGARVLAGPTVVASTEDAWTLTLPPDPGAAPEPPQNVLDPGEYQALLTYTGLAPGAPATFTLSFVTDSNPPAGNISVELFAEASGILATVWFDHVRFTALRNDPLTLTATGKVKQASHIVQAEVVKAFDGKARIVRWTEP